MSLQYLGNSSIDVSKTLKEENIMRAGKVINSFIVLHVHWYICKVVKQQEVSNILRFFTFQFIISSCK